MTILLLRLLNQFDYPAQSALLPQSVSEEQLTRVNSFSFTLHGLDMIFEALGGILIGATSLFVMDSVTFVVAALSFAGVRFHRRKTKPR